MVPAILATTNRIQELQISFYYVYNNKLYIVHDHITQNTCIEIKKKMIMPKI